MSANETLNKIEPDPRLGGGVLERSSSFVQKFYRVNFPRSFSVFFVLFG